MSSRLSKKVYTHKYLRRVHRRQVLKFCSTSTELNVENQELQSQSNRSPENITDTNEEDGHSFHETFHIVDGSDSSFVTNSEEITRFRRSASMNDDDILLNELRKIAYANNTTQKTMDDIMNLIRPKYPCLPRSAKTLLGTPKTRKTIDLETGKMVYFGIEACLIRKLQFQADNAPQGVTDVSLDFNIDGLPIFKSSKTQFWPILARSTSLEDNRPFAVAIFSGTDKPKPLDLFLKDFIEEIEILQGKGFIYNDRSYRLKIRCFSCDAPARAMLKSVSSHTSFHGCERCRHKAIKVNRFLFYPIQEKKIKQRKDEDFYSEKLSKHIKDTKSPLLRVVGLVSQFVLDPMHLLYLGVIKRLIKKCWLAGIRKFRLSKAAVQNLVDELTEKLREYIPNDFGRKCRGFSDIDRWKATEFRLFLLYTGPVLMSEILSTEQYSNLIMLHAATFILSNKMLTHRYLELVRKILSRFASQAADLYGPEFVSYNVHSLLHICDDVALYGTLEEYSCFPYENYLGQLKRRIRSKNKPLAQICNRLKEESLTLTNEKIKSTENEYIPKDIIYTEHDSNSFRCKILITKEFRICTEKPDNVVVANKQICQITSINFIAGEYTCVGVPFHYLEDLYTRPLPSSKLGIYFVRGSREAITFTLSEISYKCLSLPHKNRFTIFPILHQKQ